MCPAEIKAIDKQLEDSEPDNAAELEQLLVTFDLAADDLRIAYEAALSQYDGLPTKNWLEGLDRMFVSVHHPTPLFSKGG